MAIITIGGDVGAGKTTLALNLSKALGYEELYIGGVMRDVARERNMTIEKFYASLKNDPVLEKSIDDRQRKLMREKDHLIVQGRVAWYFAQESPFAIFNIFLGVNPEIGAERAHARKENAGKSVPELVAVNTQRKNVEIERYRTLYGIDNFLDAVHYDFALDTSTMTIEQVLDASLQKIKERF